eukprot:Awhi_evm1s11535
MSAASVDAELPLNSSNSSTNKKQEEEKKSKKEKSKSSKKSSGKKKSKSSKKSSGKSKKSKSSDSNAATTVNEIVDQGKHSDNTSIASKSGPDQADGRGGTKPDIENTANFASDTAPQKVPPQLRKIGEQHPLRILLVEDNLINQKIVSSYLAKLGYTATIAANGVIATEKIKNNVFDVVLMDLHMPEMDGHETTRFIRTHLSADQQPTVIALTASDDIADTMKCLSLGMEHFLSKPVTIMDMVNVLIKCRRVQPRYSEMEQQRNNNNNNNNNNVNNNNNNNRSITRRSSQ